jgi:hypothetical protein
MFSAFQKADGNFFLGQERSADCGIYVTKDHNVKCITKHYENCTGLTIQSNRRGILTRVCVQLLALEHCGSIPAGGCLTTLLTALISLRETTTSLHLPEGLVEITALRQ